MNTIYYATNNPGKILSAKKYLKDYSLEMIRCDFDEPDINDIEAIAIWKAKKVYANIHEPCIALDSGFYIPGYPDEPNFPGAFVNRKLIDGIGIPTLLEKMQDVENRECYFLECVAYYDGEELKTFFGKAPGVLAKEISSKHSKTDWSNLGSVFIPDGFTKPQCELTEEEKEHRKNITHAFLEFKKYYDEKNRDIKVRSLKL